jgi:hypothetical protein
MSKIDAQESNKEQMLELKDGWVLDYWSEEQESLLIC